MRRIRIGFGSFSKDIRIPKSFTVERIISMNMGASSMNIRLKNGPWQRWLTIALSANRQPFFDGV